MITPKIKVLRSHGVQYIPDLNDVTLSEEFRGRPELTPTDDMSDVEAAAKLCPTGAISVAPFSTEASPAAETCRSFSALPKSLRTTGRTAL